MTEQEFRELTAYQPPSPPPKAHGPAVASVAAAVAAVKTPINNTAQEPPAPEQILQVPAQPREEPVQIPIEAQIQTTAQAHAQAQGQVYPPQIESSAPAPQSVSFEMVPQQKHEELMEQYARLSDRFKRLVEERDSLSRQVSELKHSIAEQGQAGESKGRDYKEEIRLLGKLIDDEQALRNAAQPGDELYARHDKLVSVFLNIVAQLNNP
ncbi:MAG: hypothetical protein LBS45_07550 [Synergistaceae bacterium]|jgi:hypothetical protein|nr:hypothetical protein [Synergistaceae bacterium]MDR1515532.1 hypothetical protein [Synergistaceae bacterium]